MDIDITCPYNFVALNEKVIFPEWADEIYHDIPFKDALSGNIKYVITAKSPILIGSGKDKNKAQGSGNIKNMKNNEDNVEFYNNNSTEIPSLNLFCKDSAGNYFIPGTSLKGAFRSIIEILSFSKMSIYDDYSYSFRDLYNPKYKESFKPDLVHCGWLEMLHEDEWQITDCGIPGRISHAEIDKHLGTNFVNEFSSKSNGSIPEYKKPAKYKYENVFKKTGKDKDFDFNLLHYGFSESSDQEPFKKMYRIDKNSSGKRGTIVFTGQPSVRNENKKTGKWLEFVFLDNPNGKIFDVDEHKIKNFKSAYFNNEPNESEDWKYWKSMYKRNKNCKIPVFFIKENNKIIKHFGLSQLYKLPYEYKISDLLKGGHKEKDKLDFSQCLFGYISKNVNNANDKQGEAALKGRVQFGHAFISNNESCINDDPDINKILSTPKATFYPFYLIQNNFNKLKDYNENSSNLAGFKRYPVHLKADIESIIEAKENKKLLTRMRPLPAGAKFEGVISFHNLKHEELGALLSALTFNGEEGCFHTLGAGKPFGFGKSVVEIKSVNIVNYDEFKFASGEYKRYIEKFNKYIERQLGRPLIETLQYKELVSMAKEYADADLDRFLKYMKLEDFAQIKKNNCRLEPYSKIVTDYKNKKTLRCPVKTK
jgi:CRISPR-associated protein (TIGR03986 family)